MSQQDLIQVSTQMTRERSALSDLATLELRSDLLAYELLTRSLLDIPASNPSQQGVRLEELRDTWLAAERAGHVSRDLLQRALDEIGETAEGLGITFG